MQKPPSHLWRNPMGKVNQLYQDEFQQLWAETAFHNNLHPDDDFEEIEEIMREEYPNYFEHERSPL